MVGTEYNDTFASVAKMVTIRALLAVATSEKWELHNIHVHNAFLHGDVNEDVYMKIPQALNHQILIWFVSCETYECIEEV